MFYDSGFVLATSSRIKYLQCRSTIFYD